MHSFLTHLLTMKQAESRNLSKLSRILVSDFSSWAPDTELCCCPASVRWPGGSSLCFLPLFVLAAQSCCQVEGMG